MQPALLNDKAAAEFLGLNLNTFRAKHRAGVLPRGIKIGKRTIRWRVSDLLDYVNCRCTFAT